MGEKKYLIVGDGFIGNYLARSLKDNIILPTKLTKVEEVTELLDACRDRILINCAGKTGRPNIDWCETHQEETTFSNVVLVGLLSQAHMDRQRYWINIGSGCVYDGYEKNWTEEDEPNYHGSFYADSKIRAQFILERDAYCLNLRIRMPISEYHHERSFIDKIIKISQTGRLFSAVNSVTLLPDFVGAVQVLSEKGVTGIVNVVNPNPMSHEEMLVLYKDIVQPNFQFKIYDRTEVMTGLKAGRSNCILSCEKAVKLGAYFHDTRLGLAKMFQKWRGKEK